MKNRIIWATSMKKYPRWYCSINDSELEMSFFPEKDGSGITIKIGKRLARMLSKRIVQCLEYKE